MTKLLSPVTLNSVWFKNRMTMPSMSMDPCTAQNGKTTSFHMPHYSRAASQTGRKTAADELNAAIPGPNQYEWGWM